MHEMSTVNIKRCYRHALERFWGRNDNGRDLIAAALEKSKDSIDAYAAFGNPRIPSPKDLLKVYVTGFERAKHRYHREKEFVIFDMNADACGYVADRQVAHFNADLYEGHVGKIDGAVDQLDIDSPAGRASALRRIYLHSGIAVQMICTILGMDHHCLIGAMVEFEGCPSLVRPLKLQALQAFVAAEIGEAA